MDDNFFDNSDLYHKKRTNIFAQQISGSGFIDVAKMERENTRPAFSGEMHPISIPSMARYNFLGPKTEVQKRLNRGDKPINDLDQVAMKHDVDYLEASNDLKHAVIDKKAFLDKIKFADKVFRQNALKTKDAPIMKHVAEKMILAKEIAEDIGLLSTKTFSGGKKKKGKAPLPADRLKMLVDQERKRSGKNTRLEIKTGGFIPIAVAGAAALTGALSALAGKAVDSLYDYFFKKGNGVGFVDDKDLTKEEKIKSIVKNVDPKEILKLIQ